MAGGTTLNFVLFYFFAALAVISAALVVTARNVWLRVALRQTCCGHDGEPGC